MKNMGLLAVVTALVCGCASAPTPEEVAAADYGQEMKPGECLAVVEPFIADKMKDPGSVQFRHTDCQKGFWGSAPIFGMPHAFGYIQIGMINAKNAYGGYVGFRPYKALIRNGAVVRHCISDTEGICMPMGQ